MVDHSEDMKPQMAHTERGEAVKFANRILDSVGIDPDSDLTILARQFLRAAEVDPFTKPKSHDGINIKELEHVLLTAKYEIVDLRRRNELLSAKVEVMDLFALVLRTAPNYGSIGQSEDVVWKISTFIERMKSDGQRDDC